MISFLLGGARGTGLAPVRGFQMKKNRINPSKTVFLKIPIIAIITIVWGCNVRVAEDFAEEPAGEIKTFVKEDVPINTFVLEDTIRRNEGLFNVMERLKVDRNIRERIIYALANEADLTRLRPDEKFAAVYDSDTSQILEFIYFEDPITTHIIKISYENDGVEVTYVLDEKPHKTHYRLIKGTLNSPSLDAEFRKMGLSPRFAQVAINALESKISFRSDARIGDEFELLLEETVYEDTIDGVVVEQTLPGRTNVLFVSYSGTRTKDHKGYRFFDGDKSSYNAHYTEDGEALTSSAWRYPLDRIHITSPYGRRRHPVTGMIAMHNGVDYRASTGTRVYAVADGRVVTSTFDNASGHYIAIRHRDNTTSYYLHLSRRNVNVGANVTRGQVIGLSGNTGLSTGPHLHFGFKQANGAWTNPLNIRMIATPKLTGEKLEKLKLQIEEIRLIYNELDMREN